MQPAKLLPVDADRVAEFIPTQKHLGTLDDKLVTNTAV
jgi:hypothetical protein